MSESKAERKRRMSRARSARYRQEKRLQVERVKGVKFKGTFGAGTMADLERVRSAWQCRDIEEAIAMMARVVAAAGRNDPAGIRAALARGKPV